MATYEPLLPTPEALNSEGYQIANGKRYPRLGKVVSTSSQADSPASHSPKPDEEEARQMTATSGQRCLELFESSNHDGSSVKMLRDFLLSSTAWYSSRCVLTWKKKTTMSFRSLYQLAPSTPRTEGIGSGLLPTQRANKWGWPDSHGKTPMLGTPNSRDYKSGSRQTEHDYKVLSEQVAMIPTPRASDYKGASNHTVLKGRNPMTNSLMDAVEMGSGQKTGLKLQPAFVEWMMGYPQGWTDLNSPSQSTERKG